MQLSMLAFRIKIKGMLKVQNELEKILANAEVARLIPTVAVSKKEERGTSSLLATLQIVPDFTKAVLSEAGASISKSTIITCYREVIFSSYKSDKKLRPDGVIELKTRNNVWRAIVESKIDNSDLDSEQIESYLDLAKEHSINAVITISNQFTPVPSHHPIKVSKVKTRSVGLFHFSWLSIMSKANLMSENNEIDDPEQSFIMKELVRYFDHPSSGMTQFTSMGRCWAEVCDDIHHDKALTKASENIKGVISVWNQFSRFLSLRLSSEDSVGQHVKLAISRAKAKDPEKHIQEDIEALISKKKLEANFDIPNAASQIKLVADFKGKSVHISMKINAPNDVSRATTSINWLTRQLKDINHDDIRLKALWPKSAKPTQKPLSECLNDPKVLLPENTNYLPVAFEVIKVLDLAGKYKGQKTFVDKVTAAVPDYYENVGQHLTKFVPKPPQVKKIATASVPHNEPTEELTTDLDPA